MTRCGCSRACCTRPKRPAAQKASALKTIAGEQSAGCCPGQGSARNERQRKSCYRDLLKVARNTLGYSRRAISWIDAHGIELELLAIAGRLRHYCDLTEKVISQTERRVIAGEKVPANEKIFSIFEPHTDIIIKDRRDEFYGHKICLTGGGSI